ncbi:MAG TPA: SDR family NAD(P)-dependent oxidoreductase [Thermoleophilaceae bacterium]|jgi:NAD(P)-dependent dehydrogenase (short-subunit alcohol dehydrogenase family)
MSDDASLADRVALVVGAGRGLGRGCALALGRAGATVVCVSRTESEIESCADEIVAAGGSAVAHAADVTDEDGAIGAVRAADDVGDLRVCVNSAGTNRVGPARDYSIEDWDFLFAVNVRATFLVCRAAGDSMLRRGVRGSIVNISSQMGSVGYPGRAAYCATKHAVDGLTKALAVEWAPDGVRVNAVAPTFVETPLTAPMLANPEFRAEVESRIPTGELATIDEVADAVLYLAGDSSRSVTGHILKVDGGWTAW